MQQVRGRYRGSEGSVLRVRSVRTASGVLLKVKGVITTGQRGTVSTVCQKVSTAGKKRSVLQVRRGKYYRSEGFSTVFQKGSALKVK